MAQTLARNGTDPPTAGMHESAGFPADAETKSLLIADGAIHARRVINE